MKTAGVTLSNGDQEVCSSIAIQVDFAESIAVVRLDLWPLGRKPDIAIAAALSYANARRLADELRAAVSGGQAWHRRRRSRREAQHAERRPV